MHEGGGSGSRAEERIKERVTMIMHNASIM